MPRSLQEEGFIDAPREISPKDFIKKCSQHKIAGIVTIVCVCAGALAVVIVMVIDSIPKSGFECSVSEMGDPSTEHPQGCLFTERVGWTCDPVYFGCENATLMVGVAPTISARVADYNELERGYCVPWGSCVGWQQFDESNPKQSCDVDVFCTNGSVQVVNVVLYAKVVESLDEKTVRASNLGLYRVRNNTTDSALSLRGASVS